MKIRVKISRKPKEDVEGCCGADGDIASPRKPHSRNLAVHEKFGKFHDSIASDTWHSSFNSSISFVHCLNDSLSFADHHASPLGVRGKDVHPAGCSKQKIKIDLERFFSKQTGHKPKAGLGPNNSVPRIDGKDEVSRHRSRSRSKTLPTQRGRRCRTPDSRGAASKECSSLEAAPLVHHRHAPRRSKSMGFRTCDEILQAYEDIQNHDSEVTANRRKDHDCPAVRQRRRNTLSHHGKMSHDDRPVDGSNKRSVSRVSVEGPMESGALNDESCRRQLPTRTRSGSAIDAHLLQAYEDMVSEFDKEEA